MLNSQLKLTQDPLMLAKSRLRCELRDLIFRKSALVRFRARQQYLKPLFDP
jgi:hypothetical protein